MKKIAILWLAAMLAGCSTTPRVVADVTIRPGDGSEVNPESWTQLKGSNET